MDDREHLKQKTTLILPATVVCWLVWASAPLAVMAQAASDGKAAGAVDYLKQVKPLLRAVLCVSWIAQATGWFAA
jgi:hypothetical protein